MSERHRTDRNVALDALDGGGPARRPLYERDSEVTAAQEAVEAICARMSRVKTGIRAVVSAPIEFGSGTRNVAAPRKVIASGQRLSVMDAVGAPMR